MALVVDVRLETPEWRKAWPRAAVETSRVVRTGYKFICGSLNREVASGKLEVSVVLAGDERLRDLNGRFRNKDRPTNVLSFADPQAPLGGIALAFETISREAKVQKKAFADHAKHMILHGFLHLVGHDHNNVRAARLMEGLEIAILASMGIPNPYVIGRTRTRA